MTLVVVALGGNALARRGEPIDIATQRKNVASAAESLAPIVRAHRTVITHGNGPQVGLLALDADASHRSDPLDVLDAETEGLIGYLLEQELGHHVPADRLATLLTQVLVAPGDPAFRNPTKPIGPLYPSGPAADEARARAAERGWVVAEDTGGVRRVVPSPEPIGIVELPVVRILLEAGVTVICAGGGGIPVVPDQYGAFRGVEAVVDKDLAAALLAERLDADHLLLLTDVDAVYTDFGTSRSRPVRCAGRATLAAMTFAAGSMGPKVTAACRFVERTGRPAAIGGLDDAWNVLSGDAGTTVLPGNHDVTCWTH